MLKGKAPYDPQKTESRIYKLWLKSGYFNPNKLPDKKTKKYSVMMAPPNITGSLHLGHVLENTMIDILVRWQRMKGLKVLWLPGIDHAGIATQNVVEKELRKQGLRRQDLGREKFLEKVWEWKEKYGGIILDQFKKIGVSPDWSRTRFTLDKQYADAVAEAFIHYYNKGWIYRGLKTISWCTRCQTSISDLEIEYKEENSTLYHIKYGPLTLATVRPETKFGDTALAVNPKDKRYKKYVGRELEIESLDVTGSLDKPRKIKEKIKVVADEAVDPNFGTGVIKVTPAHDILDFEISQRHKDIPLKQVIDQYGRMNENAGKYAGMKVKEAREKIVNDLREVGLIVKEEPYRHNATFCSRCDSVIEPLPSKQWFLKMDKLAAMARQAIKSKVKIMPRNFERGALAWLSNIRDWCISRQLWWGHQLPVWFRKDNREKFVVTPKKPRGYFQSEDVLDTWFSSALWPFATLGWPNQTKDLKNYYPTDFITSAREIVNLWIIRMIYSGMEFTKKEPFKTVLVHGTILTKDGKRMSKSLGTGVDPLPLVEQYGADALRFGVIWQAMGTQDIRWDETAVLAGKKFANKIWNAARFVLAQTNIEKSDFRRKSDFHKLTVNQLKRTKKSVEKDLANYRFGHALHKAYDFFWHDFCDVCLEKAKKNPGKETSAALAYVLKESLKILHPFMPFVTEAIYQELNKKELLMTTKW